MPNRLANETSPYLLQHKDNPVEWLPWGPEALARAKAEDKPILLSIGYSACHWCHVMAHESFEDADIARKMNEGFVNVKVDREERPDLDELYMRAVQAFTGGHGGWPMTVFLTPEGKPFWGGTYFPPTPSRGMPSFPQVLDHVRTLWQTDRARVTDVTGKVGGYLASAGRLPRAEGALTDDWLDRLAGVLDQEFDETNAGFGGAPKFPPHGSLAVLLAHWRRTGNQRSLDMATRTLDAMAKGGMYDLLGGGFARYSVDAAWKVPHFEKMLYDNAQLVPLYVDAWKVTKDESYARVVRETLNWVLREMTAPEGGFRSSLDADSEGEEGKFYVWTPAELRSVLGLLEGMRVSSLLSVTDEGTFEHGTSVLRMDIPRERLGDATRAELDAALPRLLEARGKRVHPGRDDKIVTAWNALMISAFARAAAAFDEPVWRGAAARAARFLLDQLRLPTASGARLQRTWKDGRAHIPGFADDHAFLVNALIDVFESTFDFDWLAEANALADTTVNLFWDAQEGGLFYTGTDAEVLLTRSKHLLGGAEPSANGVAALAFARLAELSGRDDLGEKADTILRAYQALLDRAPRALGVEALAAAWRTGPTQQIGILGGHAERLIEAVYRTYAPFAVVAWHPDDQVPPLLPWLEEKFAVNGVATVYLCEQRTCKAPTQDPGELLAQLEASYHPEREPVAPRATVRVRAPALPSDTGAWLNATPLSLDDLRGNVVVLDFWTYCCINCMHVLPELQKLEEATVDDPVVVIGVHSAKFATEREPANVERAMRRHHVHHPVVLDPTHRLWDAYAVRSWPTVVVLDTLGRVAWQKAGEATHEELLPVVHKLLEEARAAGTLAEKPAWRPGEPPAVPAGLSFPGKVHVSPDLLGQAHGQDPFGPDARLYVADTGNHRIVELALARGPDGWPVATRLRTFGGNGPGLMDGPGDHAAFRSPQGVARAGDTLWVADTENHAIRRIDLRNGEVHTVAGTGRLGRGREVGAEPNKVSLRSPWDVAVSTDKDGNPEAVFIAMAGMHQVWVYLPKANQVGPLFGSGQEEHVDGPPAEAALAQPSGLSLVGRYLFFADSETSSVRVFDLGEHKVGTLVGQGLFDFGDVDGPPDKALLQHPLAVAAAEGQLYVADTFNHKIKSIDLRGGDIHTLAGGPGELSEPGGLAVAGDYLVVADTNHHRLRVVHRRSGELRDLPVRGGA